MHEQYAKLWLWMVRVLEEGGVERFVIAIGDAEDLMFDVDERK